MLHGDANCDGRIDAADVTAVIALIPFIDSGDCGGADANDDDRVDAADIDATIRLLYQE